MWMSQPGGVRAGEAVLLLAVCCTRKAVPESAAHVATGGKASWLTNPATTPNQNQGYGGVYTKTHLIYELLENVKELNL